MFYFPRFNPIEFRAQPQPYPTEDWDIYNPCRSNYICGIGDVLTFAVYCSIAPTDNRIHIEIVDIDSGATIQTYSMVYTSGQKLYAFNSYVFSTLGNFRVNVWYTDSVLGTATFYSEKIVCTDDLEYTRLLSWKKSGRWFNFDCDDLYVFDNTFCFYKRLDISCYKSKSFGVTNTLFDNGWGKFAIVDSYPITYLDLHIGYIYGLTDYTQEMCHLLRSMDYIALDGQQLQITDETEFAFEDADDHEDRRGVTLSKLVAYDQYYNINVLLNPPVTYTPNQPPLLGTGIWLGDEIWYQGIIWKA